MSMANPERYRELAGQAATRQERAAFLAEADRIEQRETQRTQITQVNITIEVKR